MIFLTDPFPVVSKWLGKIKTLIVGLYAGSEWLTKLDLLAKLLKSPGISQVLVIIAMSKKDLQVKNFSLSGHLDMK